MNYPQPKFSNLCIDKRYLSKDVILLATDGRYGDEGAKAWVNEYHTVSPQNRGNKSFGCYLLLIKGIIVLPHGGNIQAAINLDLKPCDSFDKLIIKAGNFFPPNFIVVYFPAIFFIDKF